MLRSRPAALASLALLLAVAAAGCSAPSEGTQDDDTMDPTPRASISPTTAAGAVSSSPTTPAGSPAPVSMGVTPTPTPPSASGPTAGSASSAAGSPVVVRLVLDDAAALFREGAVARVTVTGDAFDHLRAGLALPAGVDVVSGEVSYEGALEPGRAIELVATLRAAPGTHTLRAWAEATVATGSRIAPSAALQVEGGADGATARAVPGTAHAFQVTLDPGASPEEVTLTATASVDVRAQLRLTLPTGATLREGSVDETIEMRADDLVVRRLRLQLPTPASEGTWTLLAALYPDAAVDGRVFSDRLSYTWSNGAWSVSA